MITFAPNTNFSRNKRIRYGDIDFWIETSCYKKNYYCRFKIIDWNTKSVKHDVFKLSNRKQYLNYKNKILSLLSASFQ